MNYKKNEKYASIAFYAFLTVCASALVVLLLFNFNYVTSFVGKCTAVFSPFIYGFVFAYLCNHVMAFFEKKLFAFKKAKKDCRKLSRGLSLALAMLCLAALVTVLLYAVLPQIVQSYEDLGSQLNGYIENVQRFADGLVKDFSERLTGEQYDSLAGLLSAYDISFSFKDLLNNSYDFIQTGFNYVLDYGMRFVGGVTDVVLGLILAIYFLISKEKLAAQAKKIVCALFSRRAYLNTVRLTRYTHKTFGGFIIGKLVSSLIIGLITFVVLWICRIPYAPLVAVIVGITDIIPFFGPIIGAVPSAFIIFIASPIKALWFIIIILIIQQIEGNIISPRILGDSIGIGAMWVVIAITIGGGFFGFAGLLLGVPATAVMYVLFKQHIEKKLRRKNAPVSTSFYKNDPPEENIIDPELVLIDRDTAVPTPTSDDDVPEDEPEEKKNPAIDRVFTAVKEHTNKKGKKK